MTMAGGLPSIIKTVATAAIVALILSALLPGCVETPEQDDAAAPIEDAAPPPEGADGSLSQATDGQPEGDQVAAGAEQNEGVTDEVANADKTVIKFKTNKGEIVGELYDEQMPITAGSFLLLIEDGFYDGLTFHRVVPDFVIQGGDPNGDGTGGPGFAIPLESPGKVHHERGMLSMARAQPLDSAGSQFFVCLSDNENVQSLDSLMGGYAAFGKVTSGMDVADTVRVGDRIESVTVVSTSLHAEAAREAAKAARIM